MTPDPLKPDAGRIRYLGVLIALALMFSSYILPSGRLASLVGALALIFLIVGGSQLLFQLATLVSKALAGRRRAWFQVAVSLIAPIAVALFLATRVDAMPLETLWKILTPWLLIPFGIIAWVSWFAGGQLNREHPFRGFLIATAVLGVLSLFWTEGMTSFENGDGESSSLYLDPERAKEARATGEYVWRFVLHLTVAYSVLLLRFRLRPAPRDEAFLKLNEALTPETVQAIVSKMGGFIADRKARPGREVDLPFPKAAIELAFLKAMRGCSDPTQLDLLKALYLTLDDFMLSDEECAILTRYYELLETAVAATETDKTIADKLAQPEVHRAMEIQERLAEARQRRSEDIDAIMKKTE